MKANFPEIKPLGERAILIEFQQNFDEVLLKKLLFYKKELQNYYIKEKIEVISTYNSILIFYITTINNIYGEISKVKTVLSREFTSNSNKHKLFHVPVCYESEFALDLDAVSNEKNRSSEEIIQLHATPIYTVYFIGFLPGFLYLGGLDKKLEIPRKKQIRPKVKKGAVGLGGNQTGIYPKTSPGGWHIIGNSPVVLFDPKKQPPCEILPGDKVKFQPISKLEHHKIVAEIEKGTFSLKTETL